MPVVFLVPRGNSKPLQFGIMAVLFSRFKYKLESIPPSLVLCFRDLLWFPKESNYYPSV